MWQFNNSLLIFKHIDFVWAYYVDTYQTPQYESLHCIHLEQILSN